MELFKVSYFLKTLLKRGIASFDTTYSPTPKIGTTKTNIHAIFPPITNAIMNEKISMSGERMAVLIIIMYAIWMFEISVVSLVTKDDVENLSMFSNENP